MDSMSEAVVFVAASVVLILIWTVTISLVQATAGSNTGLICIAAWGVAMAQPLHDMQERHDLACLQEPPPTPAVEIILPPGMTRCECCGVQCQLKPKLRLA